MRRHFPSVRGRTRGGGSDFLFSYFLGGRGGHQAITLMAPNSLQRLDLLHFLTES